MMGRLNFPKPLAAGDLVSLVAPASAAGEEAIRAGEIILQDWGLRTRRHSQIFSGHPYLANSDAFRFGDLSQALGDPEVKGIWCIRGGYGCLRLQNQLLRTALGTQSKLFIGYSDISSLHLILNQNKNWITCHGPLLENLSRLPEPELRRLRDLVFGTVKSLSYPIRPKNSCANNINQAKIQLKGSVLVGNLTVLVSHFGTDCAPKFSNRILVIEELGERGYRVDRLLQQCSQQKDFAEVGAIVFGQFLGGDEKSGENFVGLALDEFSVRADEMGIPVFCDLTLGHGSSNFPIWSGGMAEISANTLAQSWE